MALAKGAGALNMDIASMHGYADHEEHVDVGPGHMIA